MRYRLAPLSLAVLVALSAISVTPPATAVAADGDDLWSGTVTASGTYSYLFEGDFGLRRFTLSINQSFVFEDNVGTVGVSYRSMDEFVGPITADNACLTTSILEVGSGSFPALMVPPVFANDGTGRWEARAYSESALETTTTKTFVAVGTQPLCTGSPHVWSNQQFLGAQLFGSPTGSASQYGNLNPAEETVTTLQGTGPTDGIAGHAFELPWAGCSPTCATVSWDIRRAGGGDADCADLQIAVAEVFVQWQLAQAQMMSYEAALAHYLALPKDLRNKVGERELRMWVKVWTRQTRDWAKELAYWDFLLDACLANSA